MKLDGVEITETLRNMVDIKSTDRRTLPNAVADQLRELIIEGVLQPGVRLNERALCDRLQVSRTPLREAFRLLNADGLIEIQPNRGAQVVALSREDVIESEVSGRARSAIWSAGMRTHHAGRSD